MHAHLVVYNSQCWLLTTFPIHTTKHTFRQPLFSSIYGVGAIPLDMCVLMT